MSWRIQIICVVALFCVGCGDEKSKEQEADAGSLRSQIKPGKRSDIHGAIDPDTGVFVVFGGDDGPIVN